MLGCQIAQGFYFSQPLHADEFDRLLSRHFAAASEAAGQRARAQRLRDQRVHP